MKRKVGVESFGLCWLFFYFCGGEEEARGEDQGASGDSSPLSPWAWADHTTY